MTTGYSGELLVSKRGLGEAADALAIKAPAGDAQCLALLPAGASIVARARRATRLVHLFDTERAVLVLSL